MEKCSSNSLKRAKWPEAPISHWWSFVSCYLENLQNHKKCELSMKGVYKLHLMVRREPMSSSCGPTTSCNSRTAAQLIILIYEHSHIGFSKAKEAPRLYLKGLLPKLTWKCLVKRWALVNAGTCFLDHPSRWGLSPTFWVLPANSTQLSVPLHITLAEESHIHVSHSLFPEKPIFNDCFTQDQEVSPFISITESSGLAGWPQVFFPLQSCFPSLSLSLNYWS